MTAQYRPYRDDDGLDGLDNDQLAWSDHEPGTIQIYEKTTEDLPFSSNRRFLFGTVGLSLIALIFGFLIGFFAHSNHNECVPSLKLSLNAVREENLLIREKILKNVNAENIRQTVKEFSSQPRVAGSDNDLRLARRVYDLFRANSFDKVEIKNYTVLLSEVDDDEPNFVEIIDGNSQVLFSSAAEEKQQRNKAFCAYSPAADLTGDVVFVNYGSSSDYHLLQQDYNMTFTGKILIAKQFHLAADEQMQNAQHMGAAALLLYPDPEHYNHQKLSEKWGQDSIMPPDAIRRDSLLWNGMGDPLTPGYPATDYAYRLPISSVSLPSIPVQSISYSTAYKILQLLDGREAPQKFVGDLNFTYHLGPGFKQGPNAKLRLKVNTRMVNRTIQNVIGYIKGRVEPDRYVIIGNHRDSWVNGALDSASGTGALLELARVFGDLVKTGWKPRRTIVFCSWGAEEFNLIGSTEWIEENLKLLHSRGVAYINSDIIVVGNGSISVTASPLLYHAVFNATKEVPNPNDENEAKTVYDKWYANYPLMRNKSDMVYAVLEDEDIHVSDIIKNVRHSNIESNEPGTLLENFVKSATLEVRPRIRQLDMRSVYAPFFTFAGIPVVEATYTHASDKSSEDSAKPWHLSTMDYPLLHTQYDNFDLIEKRIDSKFKYHKAVTQVLGEIIRDLAESLFLPFNLLDYAQVLKDYYLNLYIHANTILNKQGLNIELLDSAIKNFTLAAIKFHSKQDKIDFTDPMAIRRINDQLMLLERAFLDQNGLPRNVFKRHIVLSPSETNTSEGETFPGLLDEFSLLIQHVNERKPNWSWDVIKAHFSILIFTIQSAAETISDVV